MTKAGGDLERVWQIIEGAHVGMLVTIDSQHLHGRPMGVQADRDGNALWFITSRSSHKDDEIAHDNRVGLVIQDTKSGIYLSVAGTGEVVTDRKTISQHWTGEANAWFAGGADDPDACLLKVTPMGAKLWETPTSVAGKAAHPGRSSAINMN